MFRSKLYVEKHAEGEHGDAEDDGKENKVVRPLRKHAREERHLRNELVCELNHLEELDTDAEGEEQLDQPSDLEYLPGVKVAKVFAQVGHARLACQITVGQTPLDVE